MRLFLKIQALAIFAIFLGFLTFPAAATTYYADINSPNPTPPYTNWATASTDIQSAVNQTTNGDLVLVNDGVYQSGGEPFTGYALTNRVFIKDAITVQSVNGPTATLIQGFQDPNGGDYSVRCAYLASNAILSGFTLTNGFTLNDQFESFDFHEDMGGGASCEVGASVSNCIISGCWAGDLGGGFYADGGYDGLLTNALLSDCVIIGCNSYFGAGACGGILVDCTLSNNFGGDGAGALSCELTNCMLADNTAEDGGSGTAGGAYSCTLVGCVLKSNYSDNVGGGTYGNMNYPCTLYDCTLIDNSAGNGGGGAESSLLIHCTLTGNSAVYNGGGAEGSTLYHCLLTNNIVLQWNGGGASGSFLDHCTLSGNLAGQSGGGAIYSTLTNCLLISNTVADWGGGGGGAYGSELDRCTLIGNIAVSDGAATGGGACFCTVNNSLLTGNYADQSGGGAMYGTLNNCTLVGNSAALSGGGAGDCDMYNCITYYNTAPCMENYVLDGEVPGTLNYCCLPDMPALANIAGNITNAPCFINCTNNDFHLQSNSPCINSGNNAYVGTPTDLDGNPRIVGGTVDIGAYEYQAPTSVISYAWLQQYGFPTDGSVDYANPNGTAFNVYQDWVAGLNPTNPASVLVMLTPTTTNNASGITVNWQSVSGINYNLQRSCNLSLPAAFSTIQSGIIGQAGTTSYTDTSATNNLPYFYRVSVLAP